MESRAFLTVRNHQKFAFFYGKHTILLYFAIFFERFTDKWLTLILQRILRNLRNFEKKQTSDSTLLYEIVLSVFMCFLMNIL